MLALFFALFLGFQGLPGTDMIGGPSMSMTNGPFNPSSSMAASHPGLHHQLRQHPSQMLFPGSHAHHHPAAAAAAAMMIPHHVTAASGHSGGGMQPHQLHPSQSSLNPADISSHMLGC